ncbi:uncharacterized protein [Rutidosis leptorrhynchoides]|uniref:uncharacterized protein n=1 Tax=Rutidosis leptorrhynchoides TaxID=125765 RepID=UPI003A9904A3
MACISSPSFTVSVNGDQYGYFKGQRGLRQGDPLSPYLFTLVMEVLNLCIKRQIKEKGDFKFHPGCKRQKLTHLCFADDLILFCKSKLNSVRLLKDSLDEFSSYSGLVPNVDKSTIFMGNVASNIKQGICGLMPFDIGSFPARYLGLPLITTRLYHKDCHSLLDKAKKRIKDWKNRVLSFAGRLQLIQSVLSSLQVYWMSMFMLPKSVIFDLEKLFRDFLWCGYDLSKGIAKVAWRDVCCAKSQGGLGIKPLHNWNKTLIAKHVWNLVSFKKSLWVEWIYANKLKGKNFWDMGIDYNASSCWRGIINMRDVLRKHIFHSVGDGRNTSFWFDIWHPSGPLCSIVGKPYINSFGLARNCKLNDLLVEGEWLWPYDLIEKFDVSLSCYNPIINLNANDHVKWRDKNGVLKDFSVGAAWLDLCDDRSDVLWHKMVWFSQNIPRHAFILWLAVNGRLSTQDRMENWGLQHNQVCPLCKQVRDSHTHLFIDCIYSKEVWQGFKGKAKMDDIIDIILSGGISWSYVANLVATKRCNKSLWSVIRRLVFAAIIYMLWSERNFRIYQDTHRSVGVLIKAIFEVVRLRLCGLKILPSTHQPVIAAEVWNFDLISLIRSTLVVVLMINFKLQAWLTFWDQPIRSDNLNLLLLPRCSVPFGLHGSTLIGVAGILGCCGVWVIMKPSEGLMAWCLFVIKLRTGFFALFMGLEDFMKIKDVKFQVIKAKDNEDLKAEDNQDLKIRVYEEFKRLLEFNVKIKFKSCSSGHRC